MAPGVLGVLRDLGRTGDSEYLDLLRVTTPEGLLEMLRVPGLGTSRIHRIHHGLGVETLAALELAARDGRLAALPGFGDRTASKIMRGIALLRESSDLQLNSLADAEARRLLAGISRVPGVSRAAIAGSLRRRCELVRDIDVVVGCDADPTTVASTLAHLPGVRQVIGGGAATLALRFDNGARVDLYCVEDGRWPMALWRTTGSHEHVAAIERLARRRGLDLSGDEIRGSDGRPSSPETEAAVYDAVGLPWIAPELREDRGELDAALAHQLPPLLEASDIRGVLHCHSDYSDGTATIEEMALAARARGWSYLGISDHSQSAFYAGGLDADAITRQHDEIDDVNARLDGFRVLKGIEADILANGRVDYGDELLDGFDYVIGSVHSRFGLGEPAMTERLLRALEDPHLTILGHPTGRLLLTREAYAFDIPAVLARAGELGVAVELNCDPHRLDLDWRWLRRARECGVLIAIGPDAHSAAGLDHVDLGIGIARKGWLTRGDVLNTRDADAVLTFARCRHRSSLVPAARAAHREDAVDGR